MKEGDKVWVKLMGFDERGKVRLSMKVVDQETGKEITDDQSVREEKCMDEKNSLKISVVGRKKKSNFSSYRNNEMPSQHWSGIFL